MHDFLTREAGGFLPERNIVIFPNGVHELMLECVLNNAFNENYALCITLFFAFPFGRFLFFCLKHSVKIKETFLDYIQILFYFILNVIFLVLYKNKLLNITITILGISRNKVLTAGK